MEDDIKLRIEHHDFHLKSYPKITDFEITNEISDRLAIDIRSVIDEKIISTICKKINQINDVEKH